MRGQPLRDGKRRSGIRAALVLAILAAASAFGSCTDPLDFASNVHDLRVLAMRSEPPDFVLDPADPNRLPVFRVTALVVDPAKRAKEIRFLACPAPEGMRCEGQDGEIELDGVESRNDLAEVVYSPILDGLDLERAAKEDPYRGFGGLPLVVTVHAKAGAEEVFGAKRIPFWFPFPYLPDLKPNVNPPEPAISVVGGPDGWAEDEEIELSGPEIELDVVPPDPALREDYVVPGFDGEPRRLRENWEYRWYTTKGRFSPEKTGGFNALTRADEKTSSRLRFDLGEEPGRFKVYVVVTDGRGGESWTRRFAIWKGP